MKDDRHPLKDNPVLWLVIGVPLIAVMLGMATLYFAYSGADEVLPRDATPDRLTKTSWEE